MSEMTQATRDKLIADFRLVLSDAEQLVKLTADDASGKLNEVRGRLGDRLATVREELAALEEVAIAKAKEAARATDAYVHENPWQSIGIAAGAGFLIGLLIGRR
ncbi:DUF883 family protein [Niveibacterium umoris]|uniref:ElaB/YqjD/DUF883 family membrane-anchored ribosome-binding protein n=1 Tax=Niveibacterium umoris TaxID=1193620 RepID=A0A840BTV3_9RHOO|nr:DUF883 family protein [Niveibacterium umoris]MBB4014236.1 ElaB/YqjD/DUF883 family membrane-anchored ribosome-binding protein [Niveibacterium umoris]